MVMPFPCAYLGSIGSTFHSIVAKDFITWTTPEKHIESF